VSVNSLPARLDWDDYVWEDPDGGQILLHGVLPTVVYPRLMRPRESWNGLALLESPDVVDLWIQEEKDEAESPGVNLSHGMISGGAFGIFLDEVSCVEEVTSGRFPDPEPRRLHRNAVRHERPVFFIEPTADDEGWNEHLTKEAKAASHWRKLLGMISIGGKWRKRVKKNIFDAQKPPKGVSSNFGSAAVLSATWWDLSEWLVGPEVCMSRNQRYASRLRGALAVLREDFGDEAVLLLPLYLPHRNDILDALNALPKQEKISLDTTSPGDLEEE
tara:strand:+ start:65802 stop:66623 length:822 start_codon:yes stop_codon:yes gene_type:complete